MYVYTCIHTHTTPGYTEDTLINCMNICMYVFMYVCMCIHAYTHMQHLVAQKTLF